MSQTVQPDARGDQAWREPAQDAAGQLAAAAEAIREQMQARADAHEAALAQAAEELAQLGQQLAQEAADPGAMVNDAARISPAVAEALSPEATDPSDDAGQVSSSPALRAQAMAQMRGQEIAAQRQQAQQIGQSAAAQREAAKQIEAGRQQQDPGTLQSAMRQHAEALESLGRSAAAASGQDELGNEPVREASQLAAALGEAAAGADPAMADAGLPTQGDPSPSAGESSSSGEGESGSASAPGQAPETGESAMADDASPGQGDPSAAGSPTPGSSTPGSPTPGSPLPGGTPAPGSTTAMVPASPGQTAAMMAGAAAMPGVAGSMPGQSTPGAEGGEPAMADGTGSAPGSGDGSSQPGGFVENPSPTEADVSFADAASQEPGDESAGTRAAEVAMSPIPRGPDAWSAGLPPAVRDAIRSGQQTELPRGYERRLREYFEAPEDRQ